MNKQKSRKINDSELDFTYEIIEDESLSEIEKLELLQDNGLELEDILDLLI